MGIHCFITLIDFSYHSAMLSRADTEITQNSTIVQWPIEMKWGI